MIEGAYLWLLAGLVLLQLLLGAFTIWSGKGVQVTTFHVAGGSATLGAAVWLILRAARLGRTRAAEEHPVGLGAEAAA